MQIEFLIGGLFIILLLGWIVFLEVRFRRLFKGSKASTIEGIVYEHAEVLGNLRARTRSLEEALAILDKKFLHTVQKVSIARFNPFQDTGGDQSFVIALLDGNDTGFILSSLYAQGRPLIYAKPIENGVSRYALSAEEESALREAVQGRKTQ